MYAYSIDDVQYVLPYLETDGIFTSIMRMFGEWIYSFLGMFLTYAETGFTALMNWDIMQIPEIQEVMQKLDVVMYSLLFIAFIGVVIIRLFTFQDNFKTIFNVLMTMMIISSITIILNLMTSAKQSLIAETDAIMRVSADDTIAETLYKKQTVDIVQSMKKGRIVTLADSNVDLKYVESDLRIKRDMLNEYYTYDENGNRDIQELNDGMFGQGDERYYRYRTDYFNVNVTISLSFVVYVLAIFKLAYLLWEWLNVNVFKKLGLAKGFWNIANLGKTLKNALSTTMGMVILYFSMTLFTLLSSSILANNELDNWLVKAIVIFSVGMAIVVGSGFVNDFLGIDDGSNFALKSIFMAQRLGRMGKGLVNTGAKAINAPVAIATKGNEVATKIENHVRGGEMSNRVQTGNESDNLNQNINRENKMYTNDDNQRSYAKQEEQGSSKARNEDRQQRFNEYYQQKYGHENTNNEYGQSKNGNETNANYDEMYKNGYENGGVQHSNYENDTIVNGNNKGYTNHNAFEEKANNMNRQQRFQDFYKDNYDSKNQERNYDNKLHTQTNENRSDVKQEREEQGSKQGYVNQKQYKPYQNKNIRNTLNDMRDEEDMEELERYEQEEMNRKRGK